MAYLLPPALWGRAPKATLHLLSSPVLCLLWSQLLQSAQTCLDGSKNWCLSIPVTSSPWLHALVHQTNSQNHPQSLLMLTSLPFLLQHAGPSAREGALALASCSFHHGLPLRRWCTDKQDREPRPSTCLPPCFPPFQQPQPAFTAVWRC